MKGIQLWPGLKNQGTRLLVMALQILSSWMHLVTGSKTGRLSEPVTPFGSRRGRISPVNVLATELVMEFRDVT